MNWSSLHSHRDQVEMLRRSIRRGRLAHTYLLDGPAGVGKSLFARLVAQSLLCTQVPDEELEACGNCSSCRMLNAGSHPDFFYVGCPEDKKTIPVELFKGEQQKRGQDGLIHDLTLRPMVSQMRVAIIDDANRMNADGFNAMLKTLEEPPSDTLLMLIVEKFGAIPPTIRSRCQVLRFGTLSDQDVAELLVEKQMAATPDEAESVAAMCDGSLQAAQQLLNPELRTLRQQLYEHLSAPQPKPLEIARAVISGIEGISRNVHEQRQSAAWIIRFTQEFFRLSLLVLSGRRPAVVPGDVETFCRRLAETGTAGVELTMTLFELAVTAEQRVNWNVNPLRTLETLFDDLAVTLRRRGSVA